VYRIIDRLFAAGARVIYESAAGVHVSGHAAAEELKVMLNLFHTSVVSNGVRIAAEASAPVTAIHEGTVAYATTFTGFGKLVIVDHGSTAFSLYGYLADIDVVSGERVVQGQRLGSVGASLDGEPSLYFELRIDGKAGRSTTMAEAEVSPIHDDPHAISPSS